MSRIGSERLLLAIAIVGLLAAAVLVRAQSQTSAPATSQPVHGLKGHYYLDLYGKGFTSDEYQLPSTLLKDPDAVRVDSQVAFGRGKGFGGGLAAWAPQEVAGGNVGVIWKGYIRLPKAGTYYFTTVSDDASAVYLNQSRVALNGGFGGHIPSAAFTYVDPGADKTYNASQNAYVVPVTIEAPRVLPIEVRFRTHNMGGPGFGIDLYWVTPDSRKDAQGKPIAQIVPSEALYVEPPEPAQPAAARGANSTVSSDFLYLPADGETYATLSIRLADERGRPVSGKRVHVSGLVDYGRPDEIVQPEKPTDANGITTAKVRPGPGHRVNHDSKFFAADVTDLVDVGQVAHVRMERLPISFLPTTYAPYYDNEKFLVSPLPLVVGKPVAIKVPLTNRSKFDAELASNFLVNEFNIGAPDWTEIGKVTGIRLKPGESREVSITWTPKQVSGHLCFKINLTGRYLPKTAAATSTGWFLSFVSLPRLGIFSAEAAEKGGINETRQRNIGPVTYRTAEQRFCQEDLDKQQAFLQAELDGLDMQIKLCTLYKYGTGLVIDELCTPDNLQWLLEVRNDIDKEIKALRECAAGRRRMPGHEARNKGANFVAYALTAFMEYGIAQAAAEPPQPDYRQLAAAASDTPAGYVDALTLSMERYASAQAGGDREWMGRHLTAMRLYMKRAAEALRRQADALQTKAEQLPPEDPNSELKWQAARQRLTEQLRRGEGPSQDELQQLKALGVTEKDVRAMHDRLRALEKLPEAIGPRALLLNMTSRYRQSAEEFERLAMRSAAAAEPEKASGPLSQTYLLGNPRDREEMIDLRIRRISIPEGWKLSVVDAPEPAEASTTPATAKAKNLVREIKAGEHYQVPLPPKGQMKVASVVTPVGPLGENTTARWAVEGRIGDELIGGMVHEMHVPAILTDLQLPPIASSPASGPESPGGPWWENRLLIIVAALLLAIAIAVVVLRVRKRV